MINNNDAVGNFSVRLIANRNQVAAFECPTFADVELEVARIFAERAAAGLPTDRAEYCKKLTHLVRKGKDMSTYTEKGFINNTAAN